MNAEKEKTSIGDDFDSLYDRINKVRIACDYIQKDTQIGNGNWGYKAVTRDSVIAHLRKEIVKNEIIIYPHLVDSKSEWIELNNKKVLWYQGIFFIQFCCKDERFAFNVEAHALDSGDKAPSKAVTMAEKTALIKVFLVETGEDEESRNAEEAPIVEPKATQTREKCSTADLEGAVLESIAEMNSVNALESAKTIYGNCYKYLNKNDAPDSLKHQLQTEWNKIKHQHSKEAKNGE